MDANCNISKYVKNLIQESEFDISCIDENNSLQLIQNYFRQDCDIKEFICSESVVNCNLTKQCNITNRSISSILNSNGSFTFTYNFLNGTGPFIYSWLYDTSIYEYVSNINNTLTLKLKDIVFNKVLTNVTASVVDSVGCTSKTTCQFKAENINGIVTQNMLCGTSQLITCEQNSTFDITNITTASFEVVTNGPYTTDLILYDIDNIMLNEYYDIPNNFTVLKNIDTVGYMKLVIHCTDGTVKEVIKSFTCTTPIITVTDLSTNTNAILQVVIDNFIVGDSYQISIDNGVSYTNCGANTITLNNLLSNTSYQIIVKHLCSNGIVKNSLVSLITTKPTVSPNDCQITNVLASQITSNSVVLSFTGLVGINTYTIELYDSLNNLLSSNTGGSSPRTISGLNSNTTYIFKILPLGGTCGNTPQLNNTTITTLLPSCQISNVILTSLSSTTATLSFTGLTGVGTYTVEIYDSNNIYIGTSGLGGNPLTVIGLNPSTQYTFVVIPLSQDCVGVTQLNSTIVTTQPLPYYTQFVNVADSTLYWNASINGYSTSAFPTEGMCFTGNSYSTNLYTSTNAPLAVGDTVYVNTALTIPLSNKKYIKNNIGNNTIFKVNSSGLIYGVANASDIGNTGQC